MLSPSHIVFEFPPAPFGFVVTAVDRCPDYAHHFRPAITLKHPRTEEITEARLFEPMGYLTPLQPIPLSNPFLSCLSPNFYPLLCPSGKALRDAGLPQNTLVVSIMRESETVFPHGDTSLRPGDTVIIMADPASERALREFLGDLKKAGSHSPTHMKI
jgi:hypothetical protein